MKLSPAKATKTLRRPSPCGDRLWCDAETRGDVHDIAILARHSGDAERKLEARSQQTDVANGPFGLFRCPSDRTVLHRLQHLSGHLGVRHVRQRRASLRPARPRPGDRSRVRVRQRLPRYRQRRRNGDLHPFAAGPSRRGLVGLLQFPRRAAVDRRGRLRHRIAAARRIDPPGRLAERDLRWCSRC